MMKNCEYWQQQISRFLDGDLSPEEEAALWEHIAQCPDCEQAFEEFSQQTSVLRAQVVRPPVDLSRLVMARIKSGQTEPASFSRTGAKKPVSHRLRSWRKVALAACFVAVVAVGAMAGVFSRGTRPAAGGDTASYLPEARNETVYAAVPNQADTGSEPAPQDDLAQPPAEVPAPTQPPVEVLPAQDAAQDIAAPPAMSEPTPEPPAPAAEQSALAEAAPAADGDSGIMTIMEPPVVPAEADTEDGCVFTADGTAAGRIQDGDALAALLTGESWQGADPQPIYTLSLDGTAYAFAADESGGLLWRQDGQAGWTLSPAPLTDLVALIVQ